MDYILNKSDILNTLSIWSNFLKKKVHLIACGGTALTLLDLKASTKDVDFIVPIESEYSYLLRILKDLGYAQTTSTKWKREDEQYEYDLFKGKFVHTTELLDSPLDEGKHFLFTEFSHVYIGILNYYDLIISKLFRGTSVDIEDCLALIKTKKDKIDIDLFKKRFIETAKYEVAENRVIKNLEGFLEILKGEKVYE